MAYVPANNWLIAFAVLAGAALLLSLLFALLFVWVARRFFQLAPQRALAFSFATQAVLILAAWLAIEDPRDGLRFYIFILAPVALVHLLLAPFIRKA
jgi:hypothetical protein